MLQTTVEVYGFIGHDVSFLESNSIEPSNRQILELNDYIKFKTKRETMIGGKNTTISSSFVRIQGADGKQYLTTFEHLVNEKNSTCLKRIMGEKFSPFYFSY